MTEGDWGELWELYQRCNTLPPDERARLLAQLPPHLAEELTALLEEDAESDAEPPAPGREYGRYTLIAPLGAGGMGEVFSARDRELGRVVAVKFLGAHARLLPEARDRLIREAQAASALNHPNLVTVHEVLRFGAGIALVTELVNGQSLRMFCGVPRPVQQVAAWGAQIARALAVAHAESIVHSDIKPENIMLRSDGYIKILDFGLAQTIGLDAVIDRLPLGTIGYMSPEQTRGRNLSGASDVFSLGVMLVELATGKHPFLAATASATTIAITRQEIDYRPSALPGGKPFALLLRAMLDKDPARRPAMAEVAARLDCIASPSARGRRWLWAAALCAALAAAFPWLRGGNHAPFALSSPIAVTKNSGIEHQPAFSSDGSRLAFVWSGPDGLQDDLYVRSAAGVDDPPQRVTHDGNQEFSPAWSPDGKYLAWRRRSLDGGDGELLVAEVTGLNVAQPRVVATTANDGGFHGLAWTPDSTALISRDAGKQGYHLFHIRIADGARTQLTDEPGVHDHQPVVSPDGNRLLFFRYNISRPQVCFAPLEPPPIHPVCHEIRTGLDSATWTLDSQGILVHTGGALWLLDTARFEAAPFKLQDGAFANLRTDVANRRYAFNRTITDANILAFDIPGQTLSRLISSSEEDSEPHFSPDGSRILFRSQRSGHFELYTCARDGSGLHQLTHLSSHCGSARWSPDGKWIAYDSVQDFPGPAGQKNFDNIYVIPAEGGSPRRLTDDTAGAVVPNWSADSRWIYFSRGKENQSWKVAVDGGPAVLVNTREMWGAVESADGKWIWFERPTSGKGLWRRPVSGGPEERIPGADNLTYRTWELRGDQLVFLSSGATPGFWRINVARGIGSARRLVAPPPRRLLLGPGTMSVSPDARTLLYTSEDVTLGDIYVVTPAPR